MYLKYSKSNATDKRCFEGTFKLRYNYKPIKPCGRPVDICLILCFGVEKNKSLISVV
jgi:hypothetical protein